MTSAIRDRIALMVAFIRTRWGFRFRTRADLLAYQKRRIGRFLKGSAAKSDFYRSTAHLALDRQPIIDKQVILDAFSAFNSERTDLGTALTQAFRAERERDFAATLPGGITVGSSSGTSGQPTVFLVSSRERSVWAGVILARMLTTPLLRRILNPLARPVRIAFFLRADSNLYQTLSSFRVRFQFFDLFYPLDDHADALSRYDPDILVAPPSVLQRLASLQSERGLHIHPQQVISVAETLEDGDARAIQAVWSTVPQQIYQATEGFLGFSCAYGSIHLNEEFVHVELQPLVPGGDRFVATITDFCRTTQLFIRYRMDDVLRVDSQPCPCGRVTVRLKAIEGRHDDILWLPALASETLKPVFPDQVRRAMMLALPFVDDYRIEQHGMSLQVALKPGQALPDSTTWLGLEREMVKLSHTLGVCLPRVVGMDFPASSPLSKRRRIRCVRKPSGIDSTDIQYPVAVGSP